MSALILFRTLLYAQRGQQMLSRRGIPGTVVKAPRGTEEKGCAYALRLSDRRLDRAVRILKDEEYPYGRVFLVTPRGELKEAEK